MYKFHLISKVHTYHKLEKLKSRKQIELLFAKGKSISAPPLKVLYHFTENDGETLQAGVTVSSRLFKKAVHRNRIKRIMREAYRLSKMPVKKQLETSGRKMILFIIFTGKALPHFSEVKEKMELLVQKLLVRIQETAKH